MAIVTTSIQSYYQGMPGKHKNSSSLERGALLTDIRVRDMYRRGAWDPALLIGREPAVSGASFGRSNAEQKSLRVRNCPDWANSPASACRPPTARVGTSRHNERAPGYRLGKFVIKWPASIAIDSSPRRGGITYTQQRAVMAKVGLFPNLWGPPPGGEYWHLVPIPTWPHEASPAIAGRGYGPASQGDPLKIVTIQARLEKLGLYAGKIDGLYGPITEAAVMRFQLANGLELAAGSGIVSGDWTRTEEDLLVAQGLTLEREDLNLAPSRGEAPKSSLAPPAGFSLKLTEEIPYRAVRLNEDGPLVQDLAWGLVIAGYLPPASLDSWDGVFSGFVWDAADRFKEDNRIRSRAFTVQAWKALHKKRRQLTKEVE